MKKDTFIKGALASTICIILAKVLGIIYVIPFNRTVGSLGGALYGYAYNIYLIFLSLSTVGVPMAISKIVSEYIALGYLDASKRSYKIASKITFTFGVISTLILLIFAPNLAVIIKGDIIGGNSLEDITYVIRVSATAILFTTALSNIRGYLQGQKYITKQSISQVIEQFVRVLVIIFGSIIFKKIFGIKEAVGAAIFGATLGGIVALIYLLIVHRKELSIKNYDYKPKKEELKITNKDILKNIVKYSIPLVLISVLVSLYTMVDMSLVIKCLVKRLGYSAIDAEYILSCITTWGAKLNVIVTSISAGVGVSLLPNISGDYILKNYDGARNKIYKTLTILLLILIPMVCGLSVLSTPVWTVFYGYNNLGISVFKISIFTALFYAMVNCLIIIMQSVNRYKTVYIGLFTGLIIKILTLIPIMLLFNKLGIHAYYGITISTILGYLSSILICLIDLKRILSINYTQIIKDVTIGLIASIIMYIVIFLAQKYIITNNTRLISIISIVIYSIIGILIYGFIIIKTGVFKRNFKDLLKKDK